MRTNPTFLVGFCAGYVLGARAGRARYEQIAQAARSFASNPKVPSTASQLQHQAGDALTSAKDKATDVAHKIPEKLPRRSGAEQEEAGFGSDSMTTQTAGSNGHVTGS